MSGLSRMTQILVTSRQVTLNPIIADNLALGILIAQPLILKAILIGIEVGVVGTGANSSGQLTQAQIRKMESLKVRLKDLCGSKINLLHLQLKTRLIRTLTTVHPIKTNSFPSSVELFKSVAASGSETHINCHTESIRYL